MPINFSLLCPSWLIIQMISFSSHFCIFIYFQCAMFISFSIWKQYNFCLSMFFSCFFQVSINCFDKNKNKNIFWFHMCYSIRTNSLNNKQNDDPFEIRTETCTRTTSNFYVMNEQKKHRISLFSSVILLTFDNFFFFIWKQISF